MSKYDRLIKQLDGDINVRRVENIKVTNDDFYDIIVDFARIGFELDDVNTRADGDMDFAFERTDRKRGN